jgi:hypothetical protein
MYASKSRITGLVHSVWLIKTQPWCQEAGQSYVSGVLGVLDAPGSSISKMGVNGRPHVEIKGINVTTGSVRLIGNSCTLESSHVIPIRATLPTLHGVGWRPMVVSIRDITASWFKEAITRFEDVPSNTRQVPAS